MKRSQRVHDRSEHPERPSCAACGASLRDRPVYTIYCTRSCKDRAYRHGLGEPLDLDQIVSTDPWAIASVTQAARIIMSGELDAAEQAYAACRLAAEPLVARWPEIPHTVTELTVILMKLAADAAASLLPVDGRRMI